MWSSKSSLELASHKAILEKRGYKILSKLGEGSYAKVYRGEFVTQKPGAVNKTAIELAVKIMESKQSLLEFNQQFLPRELYILTLISHPYIIHVHSILQIEQTYYIFMRYAEQGDLLEFILKFGMINENQARVWTRQMALALQYLHELNIVHRDIKCENILVTVNFNVKLSDFGFARYTVDPKRWPVLSETYCGSLSYVSPEILLGQPYNAKLSDLWSLGVVIFVMLNKSVPFDNTSPTALYERQMKRKFKFRSKVVNLLSNEVKILVNSLLEPDPVKRYHIEGVINSDWIMMDKRLTTLNPVELAALSNAFQSPLAPPEHFSLSKLKTYTKKTPRLIDEAIETHFDNSIGVIKSSKYEEPTISEDLKVSPLKHLKKI